MNNDFLERKAVSVIASCNTLDQLLTAEIWAKRACGGLTRRTEDAIVRRYNVIRQLMRIRFAVG